MSSRRIVLVTAIIMATIAVVLWIRTNQFTFDIREALPFLGGWREGSPVFDLAALAVVLISCWGIWRLYRSRDN